MEKLKKREFKPNYNEAMLGINPFLDHLVIEVNSFEFKHQYKKDKDGDLLPVVGEVEAERKTSLYVASEKRLRANKLSPRAKELYLWLLYEADNGKDYLWLNRVRYMKENDINSPTTYRSAINELISNGFVSRTVVGAVYWLNPALFFNGNRIVKFPKNLEHRK